LELNQERHIFALFERAVGRRPSATGVGTNLNERQEIALSLRPTASQSW